MNVLVIGGIFREVLSRPSEPTDREVRLAGSALYAAAAASRLGAETSILAAVGSEDSELAAALAKEAGVGVHLIEAPGASGTFAYEARGDRRVARGYRPAGSRPVLSNLLDWIQQPSVILVFGHPEWDPCASEQLRRITAGSTLLFDRQGWMSATPSAADALSLPASRHISLTNSGELDDELGPGASLSLEPLPLSGFEASVIKDGPWGVHLFESGGRQSFSAHALRPIDEIGSGDVFAGAFAASLAAGEELEAGCRRAVASAAASVGDPQPLAGTDFSERVAKMEADAHLRPVLFPSVRAQATLAIECPEGPLGEAFFEAARARLGEYGFTQANYLVTPDPVPAVRLGEHRKQLPDLFEPSFSELLGWLADRLDEHSS